MISDPQLLRLRDRLLRHGFTVVPFANALEVRTRMLVRIGISIEEGNLRLAPRFGRVTPQLAATLSVAGIGALAYTTILRSGITPYSLAFGILSVLAGVWETLRFTVMESEMTRIHVAWASLLQDDAPSLALGAGAMQPVEAARDRAANRANR